MNRSPHVLILVLALLASVQAAEIAPISQTEAKGISPATSDPGLSAETVEFSKFLESYVWSWVWNRKTITVRFGADGAAISNWWVGKWELVGPRKITVSRSNGTETAVLTFDADGEHYSGKGFGEGSVVAGTRKEKIIDVASTPPINPSTASTAVKSVEPGGLISDSLPPKLDIPTPTIQHSMDLAAFLPLYEWSWPGNNPPAKIKFTSDGHLENKSAAWIMKWVLQNPKKIAIVLNKRIGFITFADDYKTATVQDFDRHVFQIYPVQASVAVSTVASATNQATSTISPPQKKIALAGSWDSPMQGGSGTIQDLARLFSGVAKPGVNLAGDSTIQVYEGVPYLTDFRQATKPLGITNYSLSKVLVACPGLPRDSLFYYAADGIFEGNYNRMYVVVDRMDQVVSVQLVDEKPQARTHLLGGNAAWRTYNFVNARMKAMNELRIEHQLFAQAKQGWVATPTSPSASVSMYRVDSQLLSPDKSINGMVHLIPKEEVRWYVPLPLIQLILTCVQKGGA